jgi:membrane protein required for colicin V production
MNAVDLVIVAVLAIATIGGFLQGFVVQIATILGAVLALAIAQREYLNFRSLLVHVAPSSKWVTVIAYLVIFLFVWAAVILIARRLRSLVRLMMLGWMDRAAGAVIGLLQGVLLIELLIALGLRVANQSLHHAIRHSTLGPALQSVIPWVNQLFPHVPY